MSERVTLVLGKNRVKAIRKDLISKSEYFALLLSAKYKDSRNCEHHINYDTNINTLRTFINWVSDHADPVFGDHRCIKPSLTKYFGDTAHFKELMHLLQLGVLFLADTLVKDLTNLVACHRLSPEQSIQVWLLAKELGLKTLRDLGKATCIDRLHDVPKLSLLELPKEDFLELVGNIRIQHSETHWHFSCLHKLLQQWLRRNVTPGTTDAFVPSDLFILLQDHNRSGVSSIVREMCRDQYWKHNIQCIVGHKQTPGKEPTKCVYGWDGSTFSEIIDLSSAPVWANDIIGLQLVGRGFDIYLVGGEYGKGSGVFQTEILRYSMIAEAWYYVTSLPQSRRQMAVAFVDTKLLVAGGIGQSLACHTSIDVYDIDTGKWSRGPKAPEAFTSESLMFPNHECFTFFNNESRMPYTYNPHTNLWENHTDSSCDDFSFFNHNPSSDPDLVHHYKEPLIGYYDKHEKKLFTDDEDESDVDDRDEDEHEDELDSDDAKNCYEDEYSGVSSRMKNEYINAQFMRAYNDKYYVLGSYESIHLLKLFECKDLRNGRSQCIGNCCLNLFDNQVANGPYLIGFNLMEDCTMCIEVVEINDGLPKIVYKKTRTDILDLCPEDPVGCFNIYNPKSLNELSSLIEKTTT